MLALDSIVALLDGLAGATLGPDQFSAVCQLGTATTDKASGLLVGTLKTDLGVMELAICWEAWPQARPEHGWIVREAPHRSGAFTRTPVPVIDDGEALDPFSDDLSGLAYDFWSYQDIDRWIEPHLWCWG